MKCLTSSSAFLASLSCLSTTSLAQQVLSSFIYTHHGERTPWIWGDNQSLTPLGARQAWQAGVNMRSRYIQPSGLSNETSFPIRDISSIFLENNQVDILSSTDEWVTASAQAFMQGLFPPLTADGQNYTTIQGESDLANGTNVLAPLGGYQYPNIAAASSNDLKSIYVNGTNNCLEYTSAMMKYYNSADYQASRLQSQDFYDSLKEPLLNGVFEDAAIGYFDAYYIWDYLRYGYVHNITVARKLSYVDYTKARLLAGNWMFAMYANSSSTGQVDRDRIRAIAGRTLAYHIYQSFWESIQSKGRTNKVNLVFGDYKPMMSFAALANLMRPATGAFFSAPLPGASMMFELFVNQPQNASIYPKTSDMLVRFLYQNSTDAPFRPVEYSLFGRAPSAAVMTWPEFVSAMSGIMISNVEDWCKTCGSPSVFCSSSYINSTLSNSDGSSAIRPAIAGVIGAIAALVFIALVAVLAMLLGGVRLHRQVKRQSVLGGFKGSEKLASDQDLTVPKASASTTIHETSRGHERVGSWELREPAKVAHGQPGIDTTAFGHGRHGMDHEETIVDPYAQPIKPRDAF